MCLTTHPCAAGAPQKAAQHVVAEGSWLVTRPRPVRDGGHRGSELRVAEDGLVVAGTFVAAALLDDEAEVDATPAHDVLDRLAAPGAAVRHALAVALAAIFGASMLLMVAMT